MIDTGRTYSQKEVDELEAQGYEFVSVQTISDRDPIYVVARYNPPRASYDLECRLDESWLHQGD